MLLVLGNRHSGCLNSHQLHLHNKKIIWKMDIRYLLETNCSRLNSILYVNMIYLQCVGKITIELSKCSFLILAIYLCLSEDLLV